MELEVGEYGNWQKKKIQEGWAERFEVGEAVS